MVYLSEGWHLSPSHYATKRRAALLIKTNALSLHQTAVQYVNAMQSLMLPGETVFSRLVESSTVKMVSKALNAA